MMESLKADARPGDGNAVKWHGMAGCWRTGSASSFGSVNTQVEKVAHYSFVFSSSVYI